MRQLFLLLFFLAGSLALHAQQGEWITYTSGGHVTSLVEDSIFIWAGTKSGLLKVKKSTGEKIIYTTANSDLTDNSVNGAALDSNGILWMAVGSTQGWSIMGFNGRNWTTLNVAEGVPSAIAVDHNNWPWYVTSRNAGLFRLDHSVYYQAPGSIGSIVTDGGVNKWICGAGFKGAALLGGLTLIHYLRENSDIPSDNVNGIIADHVYNIWFATDSGLAKLSGKSWTLYNTANSTIPNNYIHAVAEGPDHRIWAATKSGLAVFSGGIWTLQTADSSIFNGSEITSLLVDSEGKCWIGTSEDLFTFDGTTVTRIGAGNSGLPSPNISHITVSPAGVVWATTDAGIARFGRGLWRTYTPSNSELPGTDWRGIAVDRRDIVWIATDKGLAKLDGSTFTLYDRMNSPLPNDDIQTVTIDPEGNCWIGTAGGAAKFDGTTWTVYTHANSGLPDDGVVRIAFDRSGNGWFGLSSKGIAQFDGTHWTLHNALNSPFTQPQPVGSIVVDRAGNVLAGAYNVGLGLFDGAAWRVYTVANSELSDNNVSALAVGATNALWIGMGGLMGNGPGAQKLDGDRWQRYTTANSGLPNDIITTIALDSIGNVWFGTRQGIGVYREGGIAAAPWSPASPDGAQGYMVRAEPNPAASRTTIAYTLPEHDGPPARAELTVVDPLGREIARLVDEPQSPGSYRVALSTRGLPGGVYFCRLRYGSISRVSQLVVTN